ncbi:hypothetical protein G3570_01365 [Balneolaceae bacterium YR4-1]|uniref:Uncharacterized protein n=1 Tax=Halalkalibaculum roseum TaxID=2709311 RepID=A0A6M1SSY2_9BACT|nr:hypothetical protein [Halalkalibaculum roseum]NGP75266.1 hypothetical protein [Halalkalibaculum roseum]
MIDIILTIVLGSLAGVAAFLSCMLIWKVNPADRFSKRAAMDSNSDELLPEETELNEGAIMQLSVNIMEQELALSEEGTTVKGSYVNIERNKDGIQTCNKIFLN